MQPSLGVDMKPAAIVLESALERELRHERQRRTDNLLATVEERQARWDTANEMLSWFFALQGHMESAPGIDPSREVIQGLQVDRDERIHWIARCKAMLAELVRQDGNPRGAQLLWLHFRRARRVGEQRVDGRRLGVYADFGVAIRDLHEHDGAPVSRDQTIRDYWAALSWVEDYGCNRGWLAGRVERQFRGSAVQTYRRPPSAP